MLYDLVVGSGDGDLIYVTGLIAQGWVQILPSLSDQRSLPLNYPLSIKIQGCVALRNKKNTLNGIKYMRIVSPEV